MSRGRGRRKATNGPPVVIWLRQVAAFVGWPTRGYWPQSPRQQRVRGGWGGTHRRARLQDLRAAQHPGSLPAFLRPHVPALRRVDFVALANSPRPAVFRAVPRDPATRGLLAAVRRLPAFAGLPGARQRDTRVVHHARTVVPPPLTRVVAPEISRPATAGLFSGAAAITAAIVVRVVKRAGTACGRHAACLPRNSSTRAGAVDSVWPSGSTSQYSERGRHSSR